MKKISDLKRSAKQALNGNYGVVIGATLAVNALSFAGSFLSGKLFPGITVMDMILSQVFVTILTLVFSVFSAGLSYIYLNLARGRKASFGDLVYFFKHHPDRVIIATLAFALLELIVSIPMNYYIYTIDLGAVTEDALIRWTINYSALMLAATILEILLSIPFAMMYFLLADNPEMTGFEAMKASVRMMKGRYLKYLLMEISFIPLMLLSMFTLYIALLWVMPYIEMTTAMFYRDILGELDMAEQPPQEVFGAPEPEEHTEMQDHMEMQDDDQSEA